MRIIRFPKTIKIELPNHLREALDRILEQRPTIPNDYELLHRVLDEGVAAMSVESENSVEPRPTVQTVAERMERRLEEMARSTEDTPAKAMVAASLRPFPKATRRYNDPRKEHVENYVGCPIDRDLRQRLQLVVDSHPKEGLERLVSRLIALGLEQAEQNPASLKGDPAEEFIRASTR
jgi:hypothetical protein